MDQRRDIAYLNLDVKEYLLSIEVTEEAIAQRYEEDRSTYVTEPTVDVEWIEISQTDLEESIEVNESEEALRAIYEADIGTLQEASERRSAHILIVVDETTTTPSALRQIQTIAERLSNGEQFAALAAEFSQDPGSAKFGGDLGMMTRGSFDSAFEEGLWGLENPGDISEPVRSEFGYHLIQLNEIGELDLPTFADQREDIVTRLRIDAASEAFDLAMEDLEQRAFEERNELSETAQAVNATVKSAKALLSKSEINRAFGNTRRTQMLLTVCFRLRTGW